MIRKVLVSITACVFVTVVACSKSPTNPASPTSAGVTDGNAAPDGSTLKASTPSVVSPTGGFQVTDPLVLTASKAVGKCADISPSYQFQVRSGSTVVYDSGVTGGGGAGNNVTHTVPATANLNPDTDYTWRLRAVYQGQNSAWSATARSERGRRVPSQRHAARSAHDRPHGGPARWQRHLLG